MGHKKELHFKTNVQLKSIIGKDLINHDNIAILELVKNSFDADAKNVTVTYLNLKDNDDNNNKTFSENTSRLIIQDNGLGMDLEGIQDKWLNIAYSEKKINKTQHKRRMAGAKGVGRFSCDRLGEYLNLYAKTKEDSEYAKLTIDWKLFEIEDEKKEIQSIPLQYESLTKSELVDLGIEPFEQGVLLEVIKLRSTWVYPILDKKGNFISWNTDKFNELKKYLEKLINPNQAFQNNDFSIYLNAPEFQKENDLRKNHKKFIGKVENRIFEKLDFKTTSIECETQDNGKVIFTELKDKGNTVFWLKEKNPFYPHIKESKLKIYYLNSYAKSFFTRQTGIQSVNYGSVFLFINGFRIPPYGDVGDDWLALDQRKAQGHSRYLGSRDLIGHLELNDNNNDFQIISSREGIVKNENYIKLTSKERNESFYFKSHRRLEKYVVDGLNWDSAIYDGQNKEEAQLLKELEKKIVAGEIKESDLIYREDSNIKQKRIYNAIHSIVSAKANDVIELYINENLITQKIEEEREKSEREFQQLIDDFDNKKIDSETLNRILLRKAEQNADLEKQIKEFAKYNTNEVTSKAILKLQNYQKTIEKQTLLIDQLQKQLQLLSDEKAKVDKKVKKAKDEVEEVKKELTETKKQNLFLKSIKSQEFDDVLNLMHHIGISTSTIQNYIKGAVFKLENNIEFKKEELKTVFSKLNYELNKIYSISKFATKANFKVETKDSLLDIVSFIEQYLINIIKPFLPKKISLVVYQHNIESFITTFKPLELIIVLDNLINNSKKAITSRENSMETSFDPKIEITFNQLNENQLEILFQDNGIGISEEDKEKIFDYGFTTTDGSGLGLTHVNELIEKIGGKIDLKENSNRIGAKFKILINKK